MPWWVRIRQGPRVERVRRDTLEEALALAEARARVLATRPRLAPVDLHFRRFEAADQVAARVDVRGPRRLRPTVHAGLDVRGDGAVIAWTGGARRVGIEQADGETPYDALRRALEVEAEA